MLFNPLVFVLLLHPGVTTVRGFDLWGLLGNRDKLRATLFVVLTGQNTKVKKKSLIQIAL